MAVGGKDKGHGVFRYGFRRISGHAENFDSVFCRCVKIHIIVSRASHEDQADSLPVQLFDNRGAQIAVHKRADTVIAFRKGGGLFINIGFNEFDGDSGVLRSQFVEKLLVVIFRAVE